MKLQQFKTKLEEAVREYYHRQRSSGDGSGMDEDVELFVSLGQNNHDFCITTGDDGIIIKIMD